MQRKVFGFNENDMKTYFVDRAWDGVAIGAAAMNR